MNTSTLQEQTPTLEIIEYGGVIWTKDNEPDEEAIYTALNEADEEIRISQYKQDDTYVGGKWHWRTNFYRTFEGIELECLNKVASGIVDSREEAMLQCLDAKSILLLDITLMINALAPDSQYSLGFIDGQEDIKAKVSEVIL